jgi:AsmA-like protein
MRKRVYLAIASTLALGFLLPPTINLNHFRVQFSESLSRSLGRPVTIEDVRLQLLPLPGFTFRQLRISDDYEFGAEPILQTSEEDGQRSVATLRLSSLWRGRFEIASISLTQASLNIVRSPDGHWNLEHLINRAVQVPSAPTSKKQPETRTRFPYIELSASRINFKFGAEKKPFTLSDADFALWLAAENRWNVRLKATPLRTDERVTDTGSIKVSGSFDRAPQFSKTPFHLQVAWERPEVSAITLIARGHDPGWRGAVDLDSELKGTPADFTARLNASIDEFRRYDIARNAPFNVRVSCDNHFRSEAALETAANQLDFKCRMPLESGILTAQGELHPIGQSPNVALRLFASNVPASSLIRALLHAKSTLPSDLSADGVVDGTWAIERLAGTPVKWSGAVTASRVVIQSHVLDSPLAFPRVVRVNFTSPQSISSKSRRRIAPQPVPSQAVVEPFLLDLGGKAQLSALFDADGYRIDIDGPAEWQRVIQAAQVLGLHPPKTDLEGSGLISAQYSGEWQHFAPPSVSGQVEIRSAMVSLRGFSEPLTIVAGSLKFDSESIRAEQIHGSFPHSELAFIGDISAERQCEEHLFCKATFDLQTDNISDLALLKLLNSSSGLSIPFFSSARQFNAKWLLDVPCHGIITAKHLHIRNFHALNASAQLELASGNILVKHWSADISGGKHVGEMALDFSTQRPTVSGSGSLKGVRMEEIYGELAEPVGAGSLDIEYRLTTNGQTLDELASSVTGSGAFTWRNGEIRSLRSDEEDTPGLRFSAWSGRFTVEKRRIALQNTRMTSASGVHEVSGQVSFNQEWNLKFVRPNGSGFIASGTTNNPTISSEHAKLAETR